MTDKPSILPMNPHIAAAPLYVAGTSIEATRDKYGLEEIIKLASNESPLGPSPKALAAIQEAMSDLHRYPPAAATALHETLAAHYGHDLTASHFITGNGATEVIDALVRAFMQEGDNCIVCRPTFPMYEIAARRCGGETVYADLDVQYGYDIDAILKAINERTRIAFLCSPNNPSGTILTPEKAARLVAEIPQRVLVVFDESYLMFVENESDLIDALGYVSSHPNVVSLRSFSKSYGLAGLRIGYAIAAPEVATYVQRLSNPFHISELAIRGAIAALDDDEYVQRVREIVIRERVWLAEQLASLDLEVIPSQANFVAARAAYPSQALYERLLPEGVIIRPLGLFYMPDWFRVTVGTHEENARFVEVLARVLNTMAEEGVATAADGGKGAVMV